MREDGLSEATRAWGLVLLRLGLLLLAIGVLPALVQATVLPGLPPLIPLMLLWSVAPLGLLSLAIGAVLLLVGLLRRR